MTVHLYGKLVTVRAVCREVWLRDISQKVKKGYTEPPPAPAGVTRLNHRGHRRRDTLQKSARVGVGSTQGWAAFTQKLITLQDQRQVDAVRVLDDHGTTPYDFLFTGGL